MGRLGPFAISAFILQNAGSACACFHPRRGAGGAVKFLCDRCKTRYSIADDRVRGKILKIRCKNCANVITVREGMEADAGEGSVVAVRPRAAAAPGGAAARPLEAAFATAMSSPRIKVPPAAPAALEEEWYVSIDGDQSGPFSLAQAQAWVAGRAHDDELYCWSEGFDDWLPVEKVSHFRGLRGRSRPRTEPPPLPMEAEPEPQPLFAATLAALEAEAPTSIGGPPPASEMAPRAAMKPSASASAPIAAKPAAAATPSNGRATPVPGVPAAAATPSLPSPLRGTGPKPALPGPNVGPRAGAPPLPGTPTRGTGPAAAM